MPRVEYNSPSPYVDTPQTSWYLGRFQRRSVKPHSTDRLIQVPTKYAARPDLLSYDVYGTTDYWWVFMARNIDLIRDPVYDLKAGMQIYIPSIERIQNIAKG